MRTYEQALQLATEQGEPVLRGTADMYVGMSELRREQNDLTAATQHLLRSKELGEHAGLPQNRYRWCVAMARIREAQGDLDGALDLLGEAERLYVGDFFPNVRPVAALKARVWVAQGRVGEALGWARSRACPPRTTSATCASSSTSPWPGCSWPSYRATVPTTPFVRQWDCWSASCKAAEEGGRTGSVIEILVLQALAHQAQGDIPAALVPLERALTLAEPEGYVRMFVDEGPPMAQLLHEAAARGIMPTYPARCWRHCGSSNSRAQANSSLPPPSSRSP